MIKNLNDISRTVAITLHYTMCFTFFDVCTFFFTSQFYFHTNSKFKLQRYKLKMHRHNMNLLTNKLSTFVKYYMIREHSNVMFQSI